MRFRVAIAGSLLAIGMLARAHAQDAAESGFDTGPIQISPDGKWFARTRDHAVLLQPVESGTSHEIVGNGMSVLATAFSADSKMVATVVEDRAVRDSIDDRVRVYSVPEGKWLRDLHTAARPGGTTVAVQAVASLVALDGSKMLFGWPTGKFEVWDLAAGVKLADHPVPEDADSVSRSADGKLEIVRGGSHWVQVREWETGKTLWTFPAETGKDREVKAVDEAQFSPDSASVVLRCGGPSGVTVRAFGARDGVCRWTLRRGTYDMTATAKVSVLLMTRPLVLAAHVMVGAKDGLEFVTLDRGETAGVEHLELRKVAGWTSLGVGALVAAADRSFVWVFPIVPTPQSWRPRAIRVPETKPDKK